MLPCQSGDQSGSFAIFAAIRLRANEVAPLVALEASQGSQRSGELLLCWGACPLIFALALPRSRRSQLLLCAVDHDEAGVEFFNGPRWWEATRLRHTLILPRGCVPASPSEIMRGQGLISCTGKAMNVWGYSILVPIVKLDFVGLCRALDLVGLYQIVGLRRASSKEKLAISPA